MKITKCDEFTSDIKKYPCVLSSFIKRNGAFNHSPITRLDKKNNRYWVDKDTAYVTISTELIDNMVEVKKYRIKSKNDICINNLLYILGYSDIRFASRIKNPLNPSISTKHGISFGFSIREKKYQNLVKKYNLDILSKDNHSNFIEKLDYFDLKDFLNISSFLKNHLWIDKNAAIKLLYKIATPDQFKTIAESYGYSNICQEIINENLIKTIIMETQKFRY